MSYNEGSLQGRVLGPVLISEKTSCLKISWSLNAVRFAFRIVRSLWNLTGTSAALLLTCLSNFTAKLYFNLPISRLRDFTRSYDKTFYRILKRGPDPGCGLKTDTLPLPYPGWAIHLCAPVYPKLPIVSRNLGTYSCWISKIMVNSVNKFRL